MIFAEFFILLFPAAWRAFASLPQKQSIYRVGHRLECNIRIDVKRCLITHNRMFAIAARPGKRRTAADYEQRHDDVNSQRAGLTFEIALIPTSSTSGYQVSKYAGLIDAAHYG
jgi:hypothetical protein